jgi:basic membrane protein A and related proteins
MLRKVLLPVLVLVLAVAMLTSCTPATAGQSEESTAASETASTVEKLKVGVIYISPKDDGGWSQAHARGFEEAVAAIGADKIELNELTNINDADPAATETAIRQLIANECKIIFATSWGYMDTCALLAEEFTDVKFEHCSGYKSNTTNFDNYFGQIEQPRYLSGIVAGYATKTNKIGYVAAQPFPEVVRGLNAFTMGVRSVNPDAEVHVLFTNSWFDPNKEKENAIALLNKGCDVMAQHQDSPAALTAAEEAGVLGIGYDNPMKSYAEEAYLTAPIFNWGVYYEHKLNAMLDDTWTVEKSWGGMDTGLVDLDEMTDLVSAEAKQKVAEIKPDLSVDGNAKIFTGPIKDNKGNIVVADGVTMTRDEQSEMYWLVEGVVGVLP